MKIPVFHDDQHGTLQSSVLPLLSIAYVFVKKILVMCDAVVSGAGAASIACMNLLVALGLKREHITVCDSKGDLQNCDEQYGCHQSRVCN